MPKDKIGALKTKLPPELWKQIKVAAAQDGISIKLWAQRVFEAELERRLAK